MEDENSVTAKCNENPTIKLEITSDKNEVNIELIESVESVLSAHNVDLNSHDDRFTSLEAQIALKESTTDVNTALALKANLATIYTKTETDSAIATKIESDSTITKQGNVFNSESQLVKLSTSKQLPAVDGSLLTGLTQSQISGLTTALAGKAPLQTKYDSGWFAVASSTIYTKTHNLGTSNINYIVLTADDINGTNQRPSDYSIWGDMGYGPIYRATTSTALTISTGNYVSNAVAGGGMTSGFYRIIAEVL